MKIDKAIRDFLSDDFVLKNWVDIEPFYTDLFNRDISTLTAFQKWLRDKSELDAFIEENLAWRYIKMTINTSDSILSKSYQHFITEIQPKILPFDNKLCEKMMESVFLEELSLSPSYKILFRSVQSQLSLFREQNIPIQTKIAELSQQYGTITGAQNIHYKNEEITMQMANSLLKNPEENVRKNVFNLIANRKKEDFNKLNDLFSSLIQKRHQLALNAGFDNFRDYKFVSMGRFDYSKQDCFDFHDSIEKNIVPLVKKIQSKKLDKLNKSKFKPWDTSVDPQGRKALKPFKEVNELLNGTVDMFQNMDIYFSDCISTMNKMGHLDLASKKGKAPGGYNYPLYEVGVPFIFMNAVGTHRDLITMIHEGGHAVHSFLTKDLELTSFKELPSEVAELASMSMELLSMSEWQTFYPLKEDYNRAIKEHLEDILKVLPWIAQIDCFQHWIYQNSNHSINERDAKWLELSNRFGTGLVDWSGHEDSLKHSWQGQLHLFEVPFYYIEYGIAQLGAIGIWRNSKLNLKEALAKYKHALSLGYTSTIPEIYSTAGVRFDFTNDYIKELADFIWSEIQKYNESSK
ncbi:MAG: M3 family oligoendopeptidase [Crocinitomicaceae bacterium]|nr:M3 family oligoendopeptidase [Crocinitomicaceae bacterium]